MNKYPRLSFRISRELDRQLRKDARRQGVTVSALIKKHLEEAYARS